MMKLTWFVGIVGILLGPYCIGEAKSLTRVERHAQFGDTDEWSLVNGGLKHVSVGRGGVWGVNCHNNIYYRVDTYDDEMTTGSSWVQVEGGLVQVDVGRDVVWGVNSLDTIYYRNGIWKGEPTGDQWVSVPGKLKHVSVSQVGHVWGVNKHDDIYHRIGACLFNVGGNTWKKIDGKLKQISVGQAGVWGVNSGDYIYYRVGTYGDPESDPDGTGWKNVPGRLMYISSAKFVYGVNSAGNIYTREGTSFIHQSGTRWKQLSGGLKQIESLSLMIWGVNRSDQIIEKHQDWEENNF